MKYKNYLIIICVAMFFVGFVNFSQKIELLYFQQEEKQGKILKNYKKKVDKKIVENEFPASYSYSSKKVFFNMDIKKPSNLTSQSLKKCTINIQKYNTGDAYKNLFFGKKIVDKDLDSKDKQYGWYKSKTGETLEVTETSIMFSTPFYSNILQCFDSKADQDKFETNKSLEGLSVTKAFNRIYNLLNTIGIDIGKDCDYKWYCLPHNKLEKNEYAIDKNGTLDSEAYKTEWTKNDDSYYFIIYQSCQGLKIHTFYGHGIMLMDDDTAPLQAIYSRKGIQFIDFTRAFTMKQEKEKYILKSWSEIAKILIKRYEQILDENIYFFDNAEIVFLVKEKADNYELRPAWIINGRQQEKKSQESTNFQTAIDAETGEILY